MIRPAVATRTDHDRSSYVTSSAVCNRWESCLGRPRFCRKGDRTGPRGSQNAHTDSIAHGQRSPTKLAPGASLPFGKRIIQGPQRSHRATSGNTDSAAIHVGLSKAIRLLVVRALTPEPQTEGSTTMSKSTKTHRTKSGAASAVRIPKAVPAKTSKPAPQRKPK
jgi:hypothetical protein